MSLDTAQLHRHRGVFPIDDQFDESDDDEAEKILPHSHIAAYQKKLAHFQNLCHKEAQKVKLAYVLSYKSEHNLHDNASSSTGKSIAVQLQDLKTAGANVLGAVKTRGAEGSPKMRLMRKLKQDAQYIEGIFR